MKLQMVNFNGADVGIQLIAETDEERNLLWSMRGLSAKVSETMGFQNPRELVLCPSLPWSNASHTFPLSVG